MDAGADGSVTAQFVATDDTSGDGVPDQRKTWLIDPTSNNIPVTVERRPLDAGSWSTVATSTQPAVQPAVVVNTTPDFVPPGDWSTTDPIEPCTDDQAAAIQAAYQTAIDDGTNCLSADAPSLLQEFTDNAFFDEVDVYCSSAPSPVGSTAAAPLAGDIDPFTETSVPIVVYPDFFDNSLTDSTGTTDLGQVQAGVLFHELLHYTSLGPHAYTTMDISDPEYASDPILACQQSCFPSSLGNASPDSCLLCAGYSPAVAANYGLTRVVCNGQCVDPSSDASNCGSCGKVCPAGQPCTGGTCGPKYCMTAAATGSLTVCDGFNSAFLAERNGPQTVAAACSKLMYVSMCPANTIGCCVDTVPGAGSAENYTCFYASNGSSSSFVQSECATVAASATQLTGVNVTSTFSANPPF
jgi:hypothetical protein